MRNAQLRAPHDVVLAIVYIVEGWASRRRHQAAASTTISTASCLDAAQVGRLHVRVAGIPCGSSRSTGASATAAALCYRPKATLCCPISLPLLPPGARADVRAASHAASLIMIVAMMAFPRALRRLVVDMASMRTRDHSWQRWCPERHPSVGAAGPAAAVPILRASGCAPNSHMLC